MSHRHSLVRVRWLSIENNFKVYSLADVVYRFIHATAKPPGRPVLRLIASGPRTRVCHEPLPTT